MTFDELKVAIFSILENSTVNLGRKNTNSRQAFFDTILAKFDDYIVEPVAEEQSKKSDIMCIKPLDNGRGLDIGKGVKAMTAGESMRADMQLNRSPYTAKPNNGGQSNE
jgi:hypothetical protein